MNADPLFQDPVIATIAYDSPCYNTGTDAFTCECGDTHHCPVYDISAIARPWYGSFDIGAYEFHAPIGIRRITNDELRITNSPNPFTNSTAFSYSLDKPAMVHLTIINGFGQQVAAPVNGYQQSGEHKVTWNARQYAGRDVLLSI